MLTGVLHLLTLPQAVAALPGLPGTTITAEIRTLICFCASKAAFTEIILIIAWHESPSDVGSSIGMVVASLHS